MEYTQTQRITLKLIAEDLRFVYSVLLANKNSTGYSYPVALQPYLGLIADGVEQWSRKVQLVKTVTRSFSAEEKDYYTALRNNIKLWEMDFCHLNLHLETAYHDNDDYFAGICKPIAKLLKLYDIYGCFIIKGCFCDNTVLDSIYTPYFRFGNINGNYIQSMSAFLGELVSAYGANKLQPLTVDTTMQFKTQDYCGFVSSPIGHREYHISFLLFSVMCSINFLILGVDQYIVDETPTKLRFAYIQYFYLVNLIREINNALNCNFTLDTRWHNVDMRNCSAHYGLGSVLKQSEVDDTDAFGGLTDKLFHSKWQILNKSIFEELWRLSEQLRVFLKIN